MNPFDIAWFLASMFGSRFTSLTDEQYDYAFLLAESELQSVACWCPKIYPTALAIKISLLLDAAGVGVTAGSTPQVSSTDGTMDAYVIEDEVFDVRRKYKLVPKSEQQTSAGPSAALQGIIDRCKPPLGIGATLARSVRSGLGAGGCCGNGIADKAEWNHGGQ